MTSEARPEATSTEADPWKSQRPLVGGLMLLVASVQFIIAMITEELLRPGYSNFGNTISDLGVNGNGPPGTNWSYAFIFDGSIILLGILAILAILILVPCFPRGWLAYLGEAFLIVGSAGAICVGYFTEDYPWSYGGLSAHDYASAVTFIFANIGMMLLGVALRKHKVFDRYWIPTTALGVFATVVTFCYLGFVLTKGGFFGLQEGGLERFVAFPVLLWAILVGWVSYRYWSCSRYEECTEESGKPAPDQPTAL